MRLLPVLSFRWSEEEAEEAEEEARPPLRRRPLARLAPHPCRVDRPPTAEDGVEGFGHAAKGLRRASHVGVNLSSKLPIRLSHVVVCL